MRRVSSGYTIMEVMIFLTVSAAILAAAINLINGKQAQTEFDVKMRDTLTKVQSLMNDVSTGFTGGDPTQMNCTLQGNLPVIDSGAPPANYQPSCIFLGKAIQFTDVNNSATQADKLYVYSVFGSLLDNNNQLPTTYHAANPRAATALDASGNKDLTETFSLDPARVTSVCSQAVGAPACNGNSHLIGFFTSFNTEQSTITIQNGSSDVNVKQFAFTGSPPSPGDVLSGSAIRACLTTIIGTPCFPAGSDPTQVPTGLAQLQVCLSDGRHTALLTISSVGGTRPSTKLDYVTC